MPEAAEVCRTADPVSKVASLCRLCTAYCPILVSVEDGKAVKVEGNPDAGFHQGYTCPKGRALPDQHNSETRLLTSMRRTGDGYEPIGASQAMDEIAARISAIVAEHGPGAVAFYFGMGSVAQPVAQLIGSTWMRALGSPMQFSAGTIDKPGIIIAQALHGYWQAGETVFADAEGWLIVGANPIISKGPGFVMQNPGLALKEALQRGLNLMVIDPRVTETAKRAHIHLQPKPGTDPAILACLIHVILSEGLQDAAFVSENAEGLEALRAATAPFGPEQVAQLAGVEAEQLVAVARTFAASSKAGVSCGTGPSFATHSTLTEYLALCLLTICGRWTRAGEPVRKPNALLPAYAAKAQPYPPFSPLSDSVRLRVRGLGLAASGLSAAAIPDEILMPGKGQIRALICFGSNPMMALPNQLRAHEALTSLDLLVTLAHEMNETARISDYVIAPRLTLETAATTWLSESAKYAGTNRGMDVPFAQYAPPAVEPPEGSDLIEDWEFFYGLAQRQGLALEPAVHFGAGPHAEHPPTTFKLNMDHKPSLDDLLEEIHREARVPLAAVKASANGGIFASDEVAQPRDPGNEARLQLADPIMMAELAEVWRELHEQDLSQSGQYPMRLISRRSNTLLNSAGRSIPSLNRKSYNPLSMHPQDIAQLGLSPGDTVDIASPHGRILGVVESDPTLRVGVVSMTQGFGGNPGEDEPDARRMGSSTARLVSADDAYDPITGIPRMGGIPVRVARVEVQQPALG